MTNQDFENLVQHVRIRQHHFQTPGELLVFWEQIQYGYCVKCGELTRMIAPKCSCEKVKAKDVGNIPNSSS